jgi:hypothetical protein
MWALNSYSLRDFPRPMAEILLCAIEVVDGLAPDVY